MYKLQTISIAFTFNQSPFSLLKHSTLTLQPFLKRNTRNPSAMSEYLHITRSTSIYRGRSCINLQSAGMKNFSEPFFCQSHVDGQSVLPLTLLTLLA